MLRFLLGLWTRIAFGFVASVLLTTRRRPGVRVPLHDAADPELAS